MTEKIFVGNLPFTATKEDMEIWFGPFGEIIGINLRQDRTTGRPRGFGFVTYSDQSSAQEAIAQMNGKEIEGRKLTVNIATARGGAESSGAEGGEEVDTSWKTAPPPRSRQNKTDSKASASSGQARHSGGKKGKGGGSTEARSWTDWASPTAQMKSNASASSLSSTSTNKK